MYYLTIIRLFFYFLRAVLYWRRIYFYKPGYPGPSVKMLWQEFKQSCKMAKRNRDFYRSK